ncbi:MAG: deoxyguanosinetriphosphate triphosphohydrolase [Christensenellales bacterium]|jgi:dGTPase
MREEYEQLERRILSPYAVLSANTLGRQYPMEKCGMRTEFQRDRDRIIHCKSFRRLKHKTQVFIAPEGDHYRTRLTHTLEVAQIARTVSRALRLNEDLTEAIALGHDLGHTPFGHEGERALNKLCSFGFHHNEQSLRVVEKLEGGSGLNLTAEVRDGICNHRSANTPSTLEGHVVRLADKVAYINHDIDDALRAGIFKIEHLPKDAISLLGLTHGQRINTMISDIVRTSSGKPEVKMSDDVAEATQRLRKYLFDNVYNVGSKAKAEEKKAGKLIGELFSYFMDKPEDMGEEAYSGAEKYGLEHAVCDYLAGMTDRFAIRTFQALFVPKGWL